jgi:hypothetical protein
LEGLSREDLVNMVKKKVADQNETEKEAAKQAEV